LKENKPFFENSFRIEFDKYDPLIDSFLELEARLEKVPLVEVETISKKHLIYYIVEKGITEKVQRELD